MVKFCSVHKIRLCSKCLQTFVGRIFHHAHVHVLLQVLTSSVFSKGSFCSVLIAHKAAAYAYAATCKDDLIPFILR